MLLDHGLYRTLKRSFVLDYAHLWDALIRSNEKDIENYAYRLFLHGERVSKNGIDYHRLFASMLTGRSWEAISSGDAGIASERTSQEINLISTKASQGEFIVAISEILAKLPGELLLLLKTNDLLRAVDASLGVGQTEKEHMLRVISTMGWYCAFVIWKDSAQSYTSLIRPRWTRMEYWTLLFSFCKVGARLMMLNLFLELKSWQAWIMRIQHI